MRKGKEGKKKKRKEGEMWEAQREEGKKRVGENPLLYSKVTGC